MTRERFSIFALSDSRTFGEQVAAHLGMDLAPHEERDFDDGEHKVRPLRDVAGGDVCVVAQLHSEPQRSANDKLLRALFLIAALRDARANRVTAVFPYLPYARKDRRTQAHDPVTMRYLAQLIEAVGTTAVVTLEIHNRAAFDNAFRIPAVHVDSAPLLAEHFHVRLGSDRIVVVSPDVGGVKRAELFRTILERRCGTPIASAFMEKYRALGVVSGERLVGNVNGMTAVIVDDLISTGGTIARAATACRAAGAQHVFAAGAHGLFVPPATETLSAVDLDGLVVCDSVPPFRLNTAARANVTVLDSTPLIAEAIAQG